MSNFKFTGPDGKIFEIQGPAGATAEQARAIFDKQLATGGLTGIPVGGLVNAITQATGGLSAALAQLGPQATALTQQVGDFINLPTKIGALVPNAISVSDFVNTKISAVNIGTIASTQVQGLVAQTAASVNQAASAITNVKGLGQFGFNADQLQLSGLIKPGLADQINLNPSKFTEILSSPTSWTGKLGVTDINSLLDSSRLQTTVQQGLMNANFDQLKQLGTISGLESAAQLGPLLNVATKFGSGTATAWLSSATGVSGISSAIASGIGGNISGLLSGGAGSLLSGGAGSLLSGGAGSLLSGGAGSLLSGGAGSALSGLLTGGAGSLLSGGVGTQLSGLLSGGAGGAISSLLSGGSGSALASSLLSSSGLTSAMTSFASSAQFASVFSLASSFFGGGGSPLQAGIVAAKGYNNTVNRTNLDQAIKAVIGNPKITLPDFSPQGVPGSAGSAFGGLLSGSLSSLSASATSAVNNLATSAGSAIFRA
jgi:hypothetical protein